MFRRFKNWLRLKARRRQIDALLPGISPTATRMDVRNAASHFRDGINDVRYGYRHELGGAIDGLSDNLLAIVDAWEQQQREALSQPDHA